MIVTIRSKTGRKKIDVADRDCAERACLAPYWCQGTWTRGAGYSDSRGSGLVCGTRHLRGCPESKPAPKMARKGKR
jgi:hypothetical protein